MNSFIITVRRIAAAAGRGAAVAWKLTRKWLSVPVNLCLAVIGLCLAVSVLSWALSDRFADAVIFFPDGRGGIRGEKREMPRRFSAEGKAELFASELLLGPESLNLSPAFAPGTKVESVVLRKGRLYVGLSADAALTGVKAGAGAADPTAVRKAVERGMAALERTLRVALPGIKRITLAIGGYEPYAEGLPAEKGRG
jgi:hypothetical protein